MPGWEAAAVEARGRWCRRRVANRRCNAKSHEILWKTTTLLGGEAGVCLSMQVLCKWDSYKLHRSRHANRGCHWGSSSNARRQECGSFAMRSQVHQQQPLKG